MAKRKKALTLVVVLLAALGVAAGIFAKYYLMASYGGDVAARVNIPAGTSDAGVRDILNSSLGGFGSKVYTLWRMQKGNAAVAHGSYEVEPGTTALRLSRTIAKGRQTPVTLTTNVFRTRAELASRVADVMEFDATAFLAAADSILGAAGIDTLNTTAAFVPDSYEFYWTASPAKVATVMFDNRNAFWTVDRRSRAAALGLTPEQVHTLASIAVSETNKPDELGAVARLYLNRIARGMALQADPTVVFAGGDFTVRRVTRNMLDIESPYNTYIHKGLPPGPIRMVTRSALDAVLTAPAHDYLYMCARPDFSGYHDFALNYDRHRINAALYHRALERRGIR